MLLRDLLGLGPAYLAALVLLPVVLWFVVVPRYVTYRLRRAGGVRAHVVATNPLTALPWFLSAGVKHSQDRLLDFFGELYARAPAGCPNCAEISVTGNLRYIITREPEHVKAVLAARFADFGKGEQFHATWSPFLGDSIFTTDGRLWHESRGLIRPMFVREKVSDLLILERWTQAMLAQMPPAGDTVEMQDLFYRMTLDVTTDFLLGSSVDSLHNPKHEFVGAFTDVQRQQMMLAILYPLRAFIPKGKYKRGIKTIERFMAPYIEQALAMHPEDLEKLSKSDKDCTFLHQIARYSRNPKVLRDQIMAILLAGRDTTAATLSWCVYELARHPAAWARLRADVLATVGPSRAPTYADLKGMAYLTHTLNETLRLYPAVPYNLRAALEDSALPGAPGRPPIGCRRGDIVVYSTLAMQRRPDLYPPAGDGFADPAVFSPERWDRWTPKPWQFVPFNGGPRICVGQNFAMTEMAYCMVRLLQKYDRLEYRGDWYAQCHKAEIVGCPGDGVPVAFHEAEEGA